MLQIVAPAVLSVFDDSLETLRFCNRVRAALAGRDADARLDLRGVVRASSDALLLLRAVIEENEAVFKNVGGNLPLSQAVAAKFKQSGFFAGFANPPGKLPPPAGMMKRKSRTRVESEIAAELVQFAVDNADVPPMVASASYKNLTELMMNTLNHAAGQRGPRRKWMASVYCEDRVAHFNFVDLDVPPILSSVSV